MLLQANKSNLKNITKSGLKEIQSWSFLIVKQMLTDLVQIARQSRSVAELCPATAPVGMKRHFLAESQGLVADPVVLQKIISGDENHLETVCSSNMLMCLEKIGRLEQDIDHRHRVVCQNLKAKREQDIQKQKELESQLKQKIKNDRKYQKGAKNKKEKL